MVPAGAGEVARPVIISVRGLGVYAHHGIGAEERSLGQRFEFDLDLQLADCAACASDEVSETVDYQAVVDVVVEVATQFRFHLLEALGDAVCLEVLTEFPLESVTLTVAKLAPAIPHPVQHAAVTMTRTRAHLTEA